MRPAGEAANAFRAAIEASGMRPPSVIVPDGRIHRFPTSERRRDDAGWYTFYDDHVPAGAYGDWRTGAGGTWHADMPRLTPADRTALRGRLEELRLERGEEKAQRQAEARQRAMRLWETAAAASVDHPYLAAREVGAHGLRTYGQALMVPLVDGDELQSLQFIGPDGAKKFLAGGRVGGCWHSIGEPGDTICIAEGYATAGTIHESTGLCVVVAFNAGNLLAVARAIRSRHPGARLIVCADDDVATADNPGLVKAREAAEAVGGMLALPDFGPDRPAGASDFNDLCRLRGAGAVQATIEKAAPAAAAEQAPREWPAPGPIVATLKPVPAFDADTLLPAVLRDWIMDEAERMPCPPEFVAAAALVTLGSLIGARCAIKPKALDPWLIVPNLWGAIVGNPSAKKSPAWGAALQPLDRLSATASEKHRAEIADYETAKITHDAVKDAIEGRIKAAAKKAGGDPASAARELRSHAEQAPAAPVARRYKSNDSTVEKLGELLRDNPAGLLVLRDELVGLLANWDREGREGDRAFFLEAWNGNQGFDTDRIGRGHIAIPNVCLSIFGGIQPDKLAAYLEQTSHAMANDGLLQRFQMLVYPDPRAWEWRDRAPDRRARDAAFAVYEALAEFDPVAWGAMPADDFAKFPSFNFDQEGQAICVDWSGDLHTRRLPAEEDPLIEQHLTKYAKLFPALALIFHLVECATDGPRGAVGSDAALRAGAWCEFLEGHARRCYALLKDDGLRAAQALAVKLERGKLPDGFTLRDVRRNQWRNLTTDDSIKAALDWLEDERWLMSEVSGGTGPGAGRRTVRYRINPALRRATEGRPE